MPLLSYSEYTDHTLSAGWSGDDREGWSLAVLYAEAKKNEVLLLVSQDKEEKEEEAEEREKKRRKAEEEEAE